VRASLFHDALTTAPEVLAYDLAALDDFIPRGYVFTIFPFLQRAPHRRAQLERHRRVALPDAWEP
jgi:hypothetical protein